MPHQVADVQGRGRRKVAPGDRGFLPADETPIFTELSAQWLQAARTLPGPLDAEWSRLTAAPPRVTPDFIPASPHLGAVDRP
ncbi:hypothetical protein [Streptacidiphilus sp. PAMC 29251]